MDKVKGIVQRTGKKIEVQCDDFIRGPRKSNTNSLLVSAIGCVIRAKVSVRAAKWDHLDELERTKLVNGISVYFNIDWSDNRVWAWFQNKAADIYKDWKDSFHTQYKKYGAGVIAPDLVNRVQEWEWLCAHFETPEFKRRSAANTVNRAAPRLEHKAGKKAIMYHVQEYKEKGDEYPIIPVFAKVYDCINNEQVASNLSDAELQEMIIIQVEHAFLKTTMSEMEQWISEFKSFMQQYGNQQGGAGEAGMDGSGGSNNFFGSQQ